MKKTFTITGMTCMGCVNRVDQALRSHEAISDVEVNLEEGEAILHMTRLVSTKALQTLLDDSKLDYKISDHGGGKVENKSKKHKPLPTGSGIYHCPMHCEGEKDYDEPGDCPVCGMDLVEQPKLEAGKRSYTCPMHPEILKDRPGDCPICGMDLVAVEPREEAEDKPYKDLLQKFKIGVAFTLPIFIMAMSEMIPGNPIEKLINTKIQSWVQLVLSLPVVFYAGWMFFERGWKSIKTWNLNMFTLIAIGTGVAWLFSLVGILYPDIFPEQFKGESGTVHAYFEAATVILTLALLGQLLEARAHSQTSSSIKELLKLTPSDAILVDEEGNDHKVAIDSILVGDILRVKPGNKIAVDGIVIEGSSNIDESMITGEPLPVSKAKGDAVSSGTINGNKSFLMKAQKVGSDTILSQIIQLVNKASRSKAPIQKLADKISRYFVPAVILVSVLTFIIWYLFGPSPAVVFGFVNAIAVLIIACPCALGLATPMSIMVGVGKGAQNGVLFKNAEALEKLDKIDVLITDKTGTITEGKPSVNDVVSVGVIAKDEITHTIGAINRLSEHPLAEAIVRYAEKLKDANYSAENFESIGGMGVKAKVNNMDVALGNMKMMQQEGIEISDEWQQKVETEQKQGMTVSFISMNGNLEGYVTISDAIKERSKIAIEALKSKGIKVVMLTGDNENTAKSVAKAIGLNDYKAGCLPKDKLDYIKNLQSQGLKVAMAGDGINDAPALAQADIGIAMGTGTDVAIESAEITLVKGDLYGIVKAVNLGTAVMKNIKQNLFFAFAYNVLGIPIAAGLLFPFFGILLSPMLAAVAMSFSSFSVIFNSLRLRNIELG